MATQSNARATARAETPAQGAALATTIAGGNESLLPSAKSRPIKATSPSGSGCCKRPAKASSRALPSSSADGTREVEERRQDALALIAQTEQRLAQAEYERAKLARHARAELERDLLTIEGQIAQAEISLATSQRVLAVMLETSQTLASASSPPAPTGGRDL